MDYLGKGEVLTNTHLGRFVNNIRFRNCIFSTLQYSVFFIIIIKECQTGTIMKQNVQFQEPFVLNNAIHRHLSFRNKQSGFKLCMSMICTGQSQSQQCIPNAFHPFKRPNVHHHLKERHLWLSLSHLFIRQNMSEIAHGMFCSASSIRQWFGLQNLKIWVWDMER